MTPASNRFLMLCALGALFFPPAAPAAGSSIATEARTQYQDNRAYCMSGKSAQDQKTCLREAGAALGEARRGRLAEGEADFERNKFARCAVHRDPAEKEYCERRMRGEGTAGGSVEGGGLLRELVVTVPADDALSPGVTR